MRYKRSREMFNFKKFKKNHPKIYKTVKFISMAVGIAGVSFVGGYAGFQTAKKNMDITTNFYFINLDEEKETEGT